MKVIIKNWSSVGFGKFMLFLVCYLAVALACMVAIDYYGGTIHINDEDFNAYVTSIAPSNLFGMGTIFGWIVCLVFKKIFPG
jgi:hypothetical protein